MPQVEPKYSDLANQMMPFGMKPDLTASAMSMTSPILGTLTGSGAKYLQAAAPKLAAAMERSPKDFRMYEASGPFRNEYEKAMGLAFPASPEGVYATFINPVSDAASKGRTAIHEALHSLFFAKPGERGWPSFVRNMQILPSLEEKGAKAYTRQIPLADFGDQYYQKAIQSGLNTAKAGKTALGESVIEGMTDNVLKARANQFVKSGGEALPESDRKYIYDAVMALMSRGGGPR